MTIIGFCNPLLDISISKSAGITHLLQKYNLKDNDIILADESKHAELIPDMLALAKDDPKAMIEYSAGGAGLNSLRCAKMLVKDGTCRIVGSVGNDVYSEILTDKANEAGILTSFLKSSPKPTGKCACLIHGPFRSLVAFLGAANDFEKEHLETLKNEITNDANWLYITGFFYAVSPESTRRIIEINQTRQVKAKIIFNLSATFVCDLITREDFDFILNETFILIGNKDEFKHLKEQFEPLTENGEFVFGLIQKYPNLMVIITNGSEAIELMSKCDGIMKYPVPPVDEVIDTNGAGDAFIGGLLGSLEANFSINEAIKIGCFMAACVIKRSGIEPPTYEELSNFISKKVLN